MDINLSSLQAASLCISALLICSAFVLAYPLQLLLVHTLIESPFKDTASPQGYAPAPTKDEYESAGELERQDLHAAQSSELPEPSEHALGIESMHTRSVFAAWSNLASEGVRGLFRALPAQIIYAITLETLFLLLGGTHPVMKILDRLQSEDASRMRTTFSPVVILTMVTTKVLLIPLDIVIMRQIIGKPDSTTWLTHIKVLFSDVGLRGMAPVILPQVLKAGIPLLLQDLSTFLHYLYLRETVVEPGWFAFFSILEFVWHIIILIFVTCPLDAILYRAETSVVAHMPKFDAFIAIPSSYISPLAELKQIVEEETHISGRWYGRYLRSFKVICFTSAMLFTVLVISIVPPLLTGAINMAK